MNGKSVTSKERSGSQPEGAANPPAAPAASPANPAAPPAIAPAGESHPLIYMEDLADLEDFEFGGSLGRKLGGLAGPVGATSANQPAADRPLSARDLPRHQQAGMRFVEARPLPLRRKPGASASTPPPVAAAPSLPVAADRPAGGATPPPPAAPPPAPGRIVGFAARAPMASLRGSGGPRPAVTNPVAPPARVAAAAPADPSDDRRLAPGRTDFRGGARRFGRLGQGLGRFGPRGGGRRR